MGVKTEGRDAFRNLPAEAAILGAILLKNDWIAIVATDLQPEHFVRDAHAEIYRAMLSLWNRKRPIDLETLVDALGSRLDAVGGLAYITNLIDGLPKARNVEQYKAIVIERAVRRELRLAVNASKAAIEDPAISLAEAAETVTALVARHTPTPATVYPADYVANFRAWLNDDDGREAGRLYTGIKSLDMIHIGGLPKGVTVLGGRTSHGKTSLALSIARNIGMGDLAEPVQWVSGEMDEQEMTARLIACHGRLDAESLISGILDYIPKHDLRETIDQVERESKIVFVPKKLTPSQIRAGALRQKAEFGLSYLVIDYVGIMKADPAMRKAAGNQRNQIIGDMMKAYKDLADELSIPVTVLAQLSRGAAAKKAPTSEDLKESGNLEEDAHVVWLLYRPPGKTDGEVHVSKNRNGRVGHAPLHFEATCMRYSTADGGIANAAHAAAKSTEQDEDEGL